MAITLKIKRGTESQIIAGTLSLGEIALATDSKSVFIGDGVGKTLIGKTIVDTYANRPSAGKNGRLYYASDTGVLYVDNGSSWVQAGGTHTHTAANITDATATPGASKVPISNGSGKLDGWISDSASGTKGLIQLTGHLGGTAASPTVTNVDNDIITLDKMAHGTQGEILYYGASGVPYRLSPGTSGQYLKTQGTGANPTWDTVTASVPDATASVKGAIQLTGDLGGSAASPTVVKLHSGDTVLSISTITDGQYLKRSGSNIVTSAPAWSEISGKPTNHLDTVDTTSSLVYSVTSWGRFGQLTRSGNSVKFNAWTEYYCNCCN